MDSRLIATVYVTLVGALALPTRSQLLEESEGTQPNPCQLVQLVEPQPVYQGHFGWSVAAYANRIAVGKIRGESVNRVRVFRRDGRFWTQEASFNSAGTSTPAGDEFGRAISLWGDHLAVAAENEENNTGAVYVYVRAGTNWALETRVVASDAIPGSLFGRSVALKDGVLVVGASGVESDRGAAYVYHHSGNSWVQVHKLQVPDGQSGDRFGESLAVDSDIMVVGSPADIVEGVHSGSCYVFRVVDGAWSLINHISPQDATGGDGFANFLAIDNGLLMIGADGHNSNDGVDWSLATKLEGATGQANSFGSSGALNAEVAIIGARQQDVAGVETGEAYTLFRSALTLSAWSSILPADAMHGDTFGFSVAIGDGFIAIGAPLNDIEDIQVTTSDAGSVYVFAIDGPDCDDNAVFDSCENDSDFDGLIDACDNCPTRFNETQADCDSDGVGDPCEVHSEFDQIPDDCDNCPSVVNPLQEDTDADGRGDSCDNCDSVFNPAQSDADGDGSGDSCDNCAQVYNPDQSDSDGDGFGDFCEYCVLDPLKTLPGICGCGVSDVDADDDGFPNCVDFCPNDPQKSSPGICGCGASNLDNDDDGVAGCFDQCPGLDDRIDTNLNSVPDCLEDLSIPAVDSWGILILGLLLLSAAKIVFSNKRNCILSSHLV